MHTENSLHIIVYGTNCSRCKKTFAIIDKAISKFSSPSRPVQITLKKVEDLEMMIEAGIFATPTVTINGSIVLSGSIPTPQTVLEWLERVERF